MAVVVVVARRRHRRYGEADADALLAGIARLVGWGRGLTTGVPETRMCAGSNLSR